jgi:RHS repeat-associated protein
MGNIFFGSGFPSSSLVGLHARSPGWGKSMISFVNGQTEVHYPGKVWERSSSSVCLTARLLRCAEPAYPAAGGRDVYFGGKLIWSGNAAVVTDRLGSVVARVNGAGIEKHSYFPYEEERQSPVLANNRDKLEAYFREAESGSDYADQRYYESSLGRFMTSDPMGTSAHVESPGSLGQFA